MAQYIKQWVEVGGVSYPEFGNDETGLNNESILVMENWLKKFSLSKEIALNRLFLEEKLEVLIGISSSGEIVEVNKNFVEFSLYRELKNTSLPPEDWKVAVEDFLERLPTPSIEETNSFLLFLLRNDKLRKIRFGNQDD